MPHKPKDKSTRSSSCQFFVAGELCRRGIIAAVTLGNTPNTDVLCSNSEGTRFAHIQVKTYIPGTNTATVGLKAEIDYGKNFFWVLGGIPAPDADQKFEYYIIPSSVVAREVTKSHKLWLSGKRSDGTPRKDSRVRIIHLPPRTSLAGWSVAKYKGRWDLIETLLADRPSPLSSNGAGSSKTGLGGSIQR